MTHEELTEILSQHKLWLEGKGGERADLTGADLFKANLREANLYGAYLFKANLYGADLYGANLTEADMSGANLRGANLCLADLRRADLTGCDLRGCEGIMQFGPMPTSGRIIYAVRHDSGWMVQAGCFWATMDELEQAVKAKHNCPMYLGIIALLRQQWKPMNN